MSNEKKSIEENLTLLNQVVKELESGNLSLEDALNKFEEGVKLVKESNQMLTEAETKLKVLREDGEIHDF